MRIAFLDPVRTIYKNKQIIAASSVNGVFAAIYLALMILFRINASAFGPLTVFLLDMTLGYLFCVYLEIRLFVHNFVWLLAFLVNCILCLYAFMMMIVAIFFENKIIEAYDANDIVKERTSIQKFFDWKIVMAIISGILFVLAVS